MATTIKYHNAKDIEGNIVSISDVTEHGTFYCIGCGKEMMAKLGKEREHHFAHKKDVSCNSETYLHNYAKYLVKHNFETQDHFYIHLKQEIKCKLFNDCDYRKNGNFDCKCTRVEYVSHDLKDHYNTCELESEFNGFIADVKLSNSNKPDRKPLFIEIAVTHKCEQAKIESGVRIIEIRLPKDTDVFPSLNDLREIAINKEERNSIGVSFYNFKKDSKQINSKIFNKYGFDVYDIDSQKYLNKIRINENCSYIGKKKYRESSHIEIHVPSNVKQKKLYKTLKSIFPEMESCYFCIHIDDCRKRKGFIMNPNFACCCNDYQCDEKNDTNYNGKYRIEEGSVDNVFVLKK